MRFENFERGYLLPQGCKDLIDGIKLQAAPQPKVFLKPASMTSHQLPPIKGELQVPDHTTARQLADLLGQKPFKIIADAMQLGIFSSILVRLQREATKQPKGVVNPAKAVN